MTLGLQVRSSPKGTIAGVRTVLSSVASCADRNESASAGKRRLDEEGISVRTRNRGSRSPLRRGGVGQGQSGRRGRVHGPRLRGAAERGEETARAREAQGAGREVRG